MEIPPGRANIAAVLGQLARFARTRAGGELHTPATFFLRVVAAIAGAGGLTTA
jgi:hypothetical protein